MWNDHFPIPPGHVPYNCQRMIKSAPCSPVKPLLPRKSGVGLNPPPPPSSSRLDSFHVIHKVPVGDTPYVKAKHAQLVDKNPDRAIPLFWAAINSGDRVDSALKDMAIVMKQQNRAEEAIEAIKSFRCLCSDHAQESLDNVLLDLYKRCGRLDDQIALLKWKLYLIHQGLAFNGKRTKTARSQGKKFQVSIEQEASRLLGNLGWAYMQQSNFIAAETAYRKALSIEADNNKMCNLGICLLKQGRVGEAKALLQSVEQPCSGSSDIDSHLKSYERAQQLLQDLESLPHLQIHVSDPVDDVDASSCSSSCITNSNNNNNTNASNNGWSQYRSFSSCSSVEDMVSLDEVNNNNKEMGAALATAPSAETARLLRILETALSHPHPPPPPPPGFLLRFASSSSSASSLSSSSLSSSRSSLNSAAPPFFGKKPTVAISVINNNQDERLPLTFDCTNNNNNSSNNNSFARNGLPLSKPAQKPSNLGENRRRPIFPPGENRQRKPMSLESFDEFPALENTNPSEFFAARRLPFSANSSPLKPEDRRAFTNTTIAAANNNTAAGGGFYTRTAATRRLPFSAVSSLSSSPVKAMAEEERMMTTTGFSPAKKKLLMSYGENLFSQRLKEEERRQQEEDNSKEEEEEEEEDDDDDEEILLGEPWAFLGFTESPDRDELELLTSNPSSPNQKQKETASDNNNNNNNSNNNSSYDCKRRLKIFEEITVLPIAGLYQGEN